MGLVWGARRWLRATPESVWGEYDASASGSATWFRLDRDEGFRMEPRPLIYDVASFDAGNEWIHGGAERVEVTGSLNTPFHHETAGAILGWGLDLSIGEGGAGPSPRSMTLDWFDGARTRRFLGVCVERLTLRADAEEPPARWILRLRGGRAADSDPELGEPGASAFPGTPAYGLQDTRGGFRAGGVSDDPRTGYRSLEIVVENLLDAPFDENRHATEILYCGRRTRARFEQRYTSATAVSDRAAWEGQTAFGRVEATFAREGRWVTLDLRGRCRISEHRVDAPARGSAIRTLELRGGRDPATGDSAGWSISADS